MSKKRITPFTKTGVAFYEKVVLNKIMQALDRGDDLDKYEVSIKIGNDFISIPMYSETYENLCEFLNNTLEDLNNA